MASSLSSFCSVVRPSLKRTRPSTLQVKAQSYRDEGRSSNFVDANMRILRERIEEVRMKERKERCCRRENGWNYTSGYDYKRKRSAELSQFIQLVGLVSGTFGLTIVTGTLCLCLVSLLVHMNQ